MWPQDSWHLSQWSISTCYTCAPMAAIPKALTLGAKFMASLKHFTIVSNSDLGVPWIRGCIIWA